MSKHKHKGKSKIILSNNQKINSHSTASNSDFLIDSERLIKIVWRSLVGFAVFWGIFQTIDYIYWLLF